MIDLDRKRLPAGCYVAMMPAALVAIVAAGWVLTRIFGMAGG